MRARSTLPAAVLGLLLASMPVVAPAEITPHVHVLDGGDPFFSPFLTEVSLGDSVEWDNHSNRIHTVTHVTCNRADVRFDDCEFDSEFTLTPGTIFTHRFDQRSGVFDYKCTIHNFTGRIVVLDAAGARPDLIVEEIAAFETPSPANRRLRATVRNTGDGASVPTRLRFEYRNFDGAWISIGEPAIAEINAGAAVSINQTWFVGNKAGDFPVRVTADALGSAVEHDESNNVRVETIALWLPAGIAPGHSLPEPF